MSQDWEAQLEKIVDAEDFFRLFSVEFDPRVLSVNRLHILKKFGEIREAIVAQWPKDAPSEKKKEALRSALVEAYETFLTRTAKEEALFKVFRQYSSGVNVTFNP